MSPVDFRSRIVGGKNSKRGWWPWHVGIYNARGRGNGSSKTNRSFPFNYTETYFIGRSAVVRETKPNFVSSKQSHRAVRHKTDPVLKRNLKMTNKTLNV